MLLSRLLPSFIIYKGGAQYMGWHSETSDPDAVFSYSKNGWTNDEHGMVWLQQFDSWTKSRAAHRPRLIILDGHRSHITLEFCEYDLVHNIALFCLPPHSTHMLQPLDVGLFGPLQHYN
jgi:hypothetical protein